jgi:AAA family ATP:ADP antiporter
MTATPNAPARTPLDRFLSLFAEVRGGEGVSTVLLALNVFLLLSAYYIIKPVREALILTEGSAEIKSYASAGQAVLLLGVVPLYAALASRLPRRPLINAVTVFFAACLGLFFVLGNLGVPLGIVFYLWVGIFNLMVVAQFWSFANDLYTPEEGKRLFAIVAFGASAGAVLGSTTVKQLISALGVYPPLLIAGGVLLVSLVLTNVVDARERRRVAGRGRNTGVATGAEVRAADAVAEADKPVAKGDAFKLVLGTPYLLLIALMILFLNWVNTTGEYVLGRVVGEAANRAVDAAMTADPAAVKSQFIGAFYADFFSVVNLVGLLVQLFLVSRILKYLGVRVALLILPVIAFAGYGLLVFYPVLAVVRWAKTAENATDYSLQNTLRGVLFLPTTREQKYKAKQAIDTFFVRAGDVLSAGVVAFGTQVVIFGTKGFAAFNLVLVAVWLVLAGMIGTRYLRMTRDTGEKKEA